jgi:putative membrane protein
VKPLAIGLTALHGIVLMLGLFGLLVAIPHPEVWSHSQSDADFFAFAINKTGGAGMVLGALAMFAYGVWKLGWKRTAVFFLLAVGLSAAAELTGTATGWPFGGYEYQELLGYKLLGRVPYSIPLSWFYMGFAAFLLADGIVAARGIVKHRTLIAVLFGSYLLTAWDLVLDPSMAAPQLAYMHFWVWHETGPYYGMPIRNFGGWYLTGLVFIAAGRLAWGPSPAAQPLLRGRALAVPFAIYAINIVWSTILAGSAGMWPTVVLGLTLGLVPAAFVFAPRASSTADDRRLARAS